MEVLTAVLCDSAADYNGKLCILGAFDTIWARQYPAVHHHCAIALRLLFRDNDEGRHQLSINMIDSDGKSILPKEGPKIEIDIRQVPQHSFFLSKNIVVNLQGLSLPRPGQYSIDVLMDQAIIARIPLQMIQSKSQSKSEE